MVNWTHYLAKGQALLWRPCRPTGFRCSEWQLCRTTCGHPCQYQRIHSHQAQYPWQGFREQRLETYWMGSWWTREKEKGERWFLFRCILNSMTGWKSLLGPLVWRSLKSVVMLLLVKWIVCEISIVLSQWMRVMGSCLASASYFITLHLDMVTGVIVHLVALTISVPTSSS